MSRSHDSVADIPTLVAECKLSLDHHLSIIGVATDSAVRRNAATKLLEETGNFLRRWEEMAQQDDPFPIGILREGFAALLTQMGAGDSQFRSFILNQLSSATNSSCRQLLLDFLPSTMPAPHSGPNKDLNSLKELDAVTLQVIDTLRTVLSKDPKALLPVLGCLSVMPLSETGKKESFQVALASLEYVSESELPTLVTTLLRHAESEDDTRCALESLRGEMEAVESSDNSMHSDNSKGEEEPITMVVHVVLNALLDDESDNRVARVYANIFQRLSENQTIYSKKYDDNNNKNEIVEGTSFIVMDLAVILSMYQHPDFIDQLEHAIDSLLKDNQFPFDTLARLVVLICGQKRFGRPSSILYRRLISSLVSFGIFLLLAPARLSDSGHLTGSNTPTTSRQNLLMVMKQTQDFLVNLHHCSDREIQAEMVQALLHLSEESANSRWKASDGTQKKRLHPQDMAYNYNDEDSYEWFQILIDNTVNDTLKCLAQSSKGSFANFKHILVGRLTSRSFRSAFWEQHCVRHLCAILSALFEPVVTASSSTAASSGAGIQASEIMILLQKLLFTSSFASSAGRLTNDYSVENRRVVRGLLLATELVRSSFLAQGDWDCVKEWVLQVLLPATRRMVDPEIGSPGLHFLEALMNVPATGTDIPSHTLKKDNFEHMKVVLANTGLIQILAHYQQQQQQQQQGPQTATPILAYTEEPDSLFLTATATKRKKRSMVFCLAYFLRNSDLYMPSRWEQTVTWVFDLVDTYLRIGRDISLSSSVSPNQSSNAGAKKSASGKWMPHGWLQAAIEFPALTLPSGIEANTKKAERAMEWLKARFSRYEKTTNDGVKHRMDGVHNGILDLFAHSENVSDLQAIAESTLRLSLASLLSISLSLAVVKNSHAHLRSIAKEKSNEERDEILRLIQFQMFKIYDMKRRCKSVETLLAALLTSVSRTLHKKKRIHSRKIEDTAESREAAPMDDADSISSGAKAVEAGEPGVYRELKNAFENEMESLKRLKEQLELALAQIRKLQSSLFTSRNFIASDILLDCVDCDQQSGLLRKSLSYLIEAPASEAASEQTSLCNLIHLRQSLLENIIALMTRGFVSTCVCNDDVATANKAPICLLRVRRCGQIGLDLCKLLPKLRKVIAATIDAKESLDKLNCVVASLAATYLQFIRTVFACGESEMSMRGNLPNAATTSILSLDLYINCFSDIFKSQKMISTETGDAVTAVFACFLQLLQECEDSRIADEILEILCVIAIVSRRCLMEQAVSASWKVLHTVYSSSLNEGRCKSFPFALARTIQELPVLCSSKAKSAMTILRETVQKLESNNTHGSGHSVGLRRHLLRHWALFSLAPDSAEVGVKHLLSVKEELSILVNRLGGSPTLTDDREEEKKDDDKRQQGEKRKEPTGVSSITELTGESLAVALETMLHITVASMAAFSLGNDDSRSGCRMGVGNKESGPYWCIENLLILFSGLVGLYEKNADIFPKTTLLNVFTASKSMLSVTVLQLRDCVEWRNAQPILSVADKVRGRYDFGAMEYLQNLVDTCWVHTAGKLISFCEVLVLDQDQPVATSKQTKRKRRQSNNEESDGDYDEEEENDGISDTSRAKSGSIFKHYGKVNALRHSVEKAAKAFKDVAAAHNLAPPCVGGEYAVKCDTGMPRKRKAKQDDNAGYHQLDKSAKSKQLAGIIGKGGGERNRKAGRLSISKDDSDDSDSAFSATGLVRNGRTPRRLRTHDEEPEESDGGDQSKSFASSDQDESMQSEESEGELNSTESFGAMGNWGDDVASEAGSLGLEVETPLF